MTRRTPLPLPGRALALLVILLVAVTLFSGTASQPFHLDNMDFPAVANATAKTGLPIYYRGEDHPSYRGLFHPPLYIYSLAAWIRVFGFGHAQVRMFGFVCAIAQALLILAMVRTLLGRRSAIGMTVWFLAAFLLNPYTLQTASIADIDSTVYGPILCGLLLCALRISWRDGVWRNDATKKREFAWMALLLALAMWAKLTTVLLFVVVVPCFLVARLGWRKTLVYWSATVVAGAGAFALTYWLYGQMVHLDVGESVRFTIFSFLNRGSSGKAGAWARVTDKLANLWLMAPQHMYWTGLFPWAAAFAAAALSSWRAYRDRSARWAHVAMLVGTALFISIYYCGQMLTFGAAPFKYTFVCWGLVVATPGLIAAQLYGGTAIFSRRSLVWTAVVFAAFALVGDIVLRDDLMFHRHNSYGPLFEFGPGVLALVAIVAGAIGWTRVGRNGLAAALTAYVGLGFGIAALQSKAGYSTTYDYGQTGLEDTVGFLRANTTPDQIIVSMKDVGFEAERRYFENYGAIYGPAEAARELENTLASGKVVYAVFTEVHGQDQLAVNPPLKTWVEKNTTLVRSIGDYRIYRPNAAGGATAAGGSGRP